MSSNCESLQGKEPAHSSRSSYNTKRKKVPGVRVEYQRSNALQEIKLPSILEDLGAKKELKAQLPHTKNNGNSKLRAIRMID